MKPKMTAKQEKAFIQRLLRKVDSLPDYESKLEYLNTRYAKAITKQQEDLILRAIELLRSFR